MSDAVGTNPGTIFTVGPTRTVNVAWNAGSDYPYCEIYYTVNNANQAELGRSHQGTKPLTVAAGSSYHIWMIVYLGAQGQDVRVVAELRVVAKQAEQPVPPPAGSGGGGGGNPSSDRITDVRVTSGPHHVMIRFHGPPNQAPYVAIGRGAPITRDNELVFGDNLVGGGFVGSGTVSAAEKAKGEYMFASAFGTSFSEDGLDPGRTYHYLITIAAGSGSRSYQDTGQFTMLREATRVEVVWEKVLVEDDSDDLSTGEIRFWFWANHGHRSGKSSEYSNGDADSDHSYDLNRTVVMDNAPNTLWLSASARDDDAIGYHFREAEIPDPLLGPQNLGNADENVAKGEFDLTQYGNQETVPFRLSSMPGGSLKFVISGHFTVTRTTVMPGSSVDEANTGRTGSALTREPIKAGARVRLGSNDFNADGRGDILWYNASSGESQIWFLNGSSRIGRATIADGARPALIGPPWHIVGSRDFNGDGKADLLWHNSATGETQIWHLNGGALGSRATVLGENGSAAFVGAPWSIVGTNDLNGDKQSDILWHNSATGETQVWLLKGHRVSSRVTLLGENGRAALVGLPWSIVGSGDFNADGKPDVLWHNASTGEAQIWYMNGDRLTSRATVLGENSSPTLVGSPWRIAGANDFNQDGGADLLWHNGSTGETQMWLMNGRSVVRRATLDAERDGGGALVGLPWSIMNH